jgi:hypothetical protein
MSQSKSIIKARQKERRIYEQIYRRFNERFKPYKYRIFKRHIR